MTFLTKIFILACFLVLCLTEILRLPLCGKFDGQFTVTYGGKRLVGASYPISMKSPTLIDCHLSCIRYPKCKALAVNLKESLCELYGSDLLDSQTRLVEDNNWDYMETEKDPLNLGPECNEKLPCKNEGKCRDTCEGRGFVCHCKQKNAGWGQKDDCAINIAYQKVVSGGEYHDPSLAVDGNLQTYSMFNKKWLSLDFGDKCIIDEITLYNLIGSNNFGFYGNVRVTTSQSGKFDDERRFI